MMMSRLALVVLLGAGSAAAQSSLPHLLCPLGIDAVMVVKHDGAEEWNLLYPDDSSSHDTTITMLAKPCWCLLSKAEYPVYCPAQFDTCKIDFNARVTCLRQDSDDSPQEKQLSAWIVPFVGPIAILLYMTLIVSCIISRRGMAAQHYLLRLICCFRSDEKLLRWSLAKIRYNHTSWMPTLLYNGVLHERMERLERGEGDAQLCPTHLVLPTKPFVATSSAATVTASNDESDEEAPLCGVEECQVDSQVHPFEQTLSSSNEHTTTEHPSVELPVEKIQMVGEEESSVKSIYTNSGGTDMGEATTFSESSSNNSTEIDIAVLADDGDDAIPSSSDSHWSEYAEDDDVCAICMALLEDGDRVGDIECGHAFHVECLKMWLRKKNECPLCCRPNLAHPECRLPSTSNGDVTGATTNARRWTRDTASTSRFTMTPGTPTTESNHGTVPHFEAS